MLRAENNNARSGANYNQNVQRARGKPESFTDAENTALRAELRKLRDERGLTQAAVGDLLKVSQQTAGKLLRSGGFSRPSALALARERGYDSPETMLGELGALAPLTAAPGWPEQEIAFFAARRMGYPDAVLERVRTKFRESHFANRKSWWWNERLVNEYAEYRAEREAPPPPPSTRLEEEPVRKPRKRAL